MTKLGIAIDDLGPSQLAYGLVRSANSLLARDPTLDVVAFFGAQAVRPLPANFACMPLAEAWGYDGVVVATNFEAARELLTFPGPSKKVFYIWDLEWVRPRLRRPYREWAAVYRHPRLCLLVRGPEHRAIIEDCWNRPVAGLVEDMDVGQLLLATGLEVPRGQG